MLSNIFRSASTSAFACFSASAWLHTILKFLTGRMPVFNSKCKYSSSPHVTAVCDGSGRDILATKWRGIVPRRSASRRRNVLRRNHSQTSADVRVMCDATLTFSTRFSKRADRYRKVFCSLVVVGGRSVVDVDDDRSKSRGVEIRHYSYSQQCCSSSSSNAEPVCRRQVPVICR